MPRSGARVRRLLQDAALALFEERGYDETTTVEIAERAGVHHRTFFRHFADKREVLFEGEAALRDRLVAALLAAPDDAGPMAALRIAFQAAVAGFEENREQAAPRVAAIHAHAALRERASAKQAFLAAALADALQSRGVSVDRAALAAEVGMIVFSRATDDWLADDTVDLPTRLDRGVAALRELSAPLG